MTGTIDLSKIRVGDTVTVKAVDPKSPFVMTGLVEKVEDASPEHGAPAVHLTIWDRLYTVGRMLVVTDHQSPLPAEVGSLGRATVSIDGEVQNNVLVIRPEPDRLRAPWFLPEGRVGSFDFVNDHDLSNFRPLVLIDPVAARKTLEDNGWDVNEVNEILHELRIEEI